MDDESYRIPPSVALLVVLLFCSVAACVQSGEPTLIPDSTPPIPSAATEPETMASPSRPTAAPVQNLLSSTIAPTKPEVTVTLPAMPPPLNEGVEYAAEIYTETPESWCPTCPTAPPSGTQYIISINVPCSGWVLPTYAVSGDLTESKWQLAEYDALVQQCFRGYLIGSTRIADMFSLEQLQRLFNERYQDYLYLQAIAYPAEVQEIHNLYLSCLRWPDGYWETYDPDRPYASEVPYSRINDLYNSYPCQRSTAEADYLLFGLLDEQQIVPLSR